MTDLPPETDEAFLARMLTNLKAATTEPVTMGAGDARRLAGEIELLREAAGYADRLDYVTVAGHAALSRQVIFYAHMNGGFALKQWNESRARWTNITVDLPSMVDALRFIRSRERGEGREG